MAFRPWVALPSAVRLSEKTWRSKDAFVSAVRGRRQVLRGRFGWSVCVCLSE